MTCPICRKTNYDTSEGCSKPAVFSSASGDWVCLLATAEDLQNARKAAGLTQTKAADLIHYTLRSYQKLEGGERDIHPSTWELFVRKVRELK